MGECECRDVGPTKSGIITGNFDTVWFVYKNSGSIRCCDDPQRSCVEGKATAAAAVDTVGSTYRT